MKTHLEVNFLKNYSARYDFKFIDHPNEEAFSIVKKNGNTVKFSDNDLVQFDSKQTELMLDEEMSIDIFDRTRAHMIDFHHRLHTCKVGNTIDASYQHHMMTVVKNSISEFLTENTHMAVDEPKVYGSVLRWTFRDRVIN
jgi:hypothetical protein